MTKTTRAMAAAMAILATGAAAQELPLLVGGHAHGAENIKALADLGLGNFVWIPAKDYVMGNTPWDEQQDVLADVDACVEHGLRFMVTERRGLGETVRGGGFPHGGHCSGDIHDETTVREIVRRGGELMVGLHGEELDADFLQEAIRPSFRARTPGLYSFTDRAGGRASMEGELRRETELYHAWGAKYIPNMCVTGHHSGFRVGADIVIAELFEHLPTVELQLAYLRGGAKQFGGPWGVWVSPWFWGQVPCEDKELWPAEQAQPGGGHSASEFRRALWLSYVSGARLLTMQETEPLFSSDGDGLKLAAWGTELKRFWDYARDHDEPMRPIVPMAVLVDRDSGWMPAHLWQDWNQHETVWGKLPTTRGDAMLSTYLDVLLPGFGRTRESVMERKDIYPGYFAATETTPFDIVSSDITAEKLGEYPLVVALGEINMTEELHATLREYVNGGGRLLINVLQMKRGEAYVHDVDFLGVGLGTHIHASAKVVVPEALDGVESEYPEPWYCAIHVWPTEDTEVLAHDGEGNPVLTRNAWGEGTVYLSTPEYMLEGFGEQENALNFFKALLPTLVPRAAVTVEQQGDVSWIASRQGEDMVVALANHASEPRWVEVTVADTTSKHDIEPEDVLVVRQ